MAPLREMNEKSIPTTMHRILQLLSIDHDPGAGPLARLDARVKLIVAIAAILASLFSTRAALPLAMLGVSLGLLAVFGAPWRTVLLRLTAPLGLVLVVAALRATLTGATPLWSLRLGPWTLSVSREGAAEGALLAVRVLGIGRRAGGRLHLHARPRNLRRACAGCGFRARGSKSPRSWSARSSRSSSRPPACSRRRGPGSATPPSAARSIRPGRLAGIVLLRSIEQAERTHEAMTARGYQGCPAGSRPSAAEKKRRRVVRRVRCAHCGRAGGGKALPVTDPASELPAIEAERIGYAYPDGVAALEDISFHAAKGEFVAVMGANGAGKTTLMKALMRLVRPQRGQIRLSGVDAAKLPPGAVVPLDRHGLSKSLGSTLCPDGRAGRGLRAAEPGAGRGRGRPARRRGPGGRRRGAACEAARSITSVSASRSGRAWRACWRCGLRSSSSTSRPPASTRSAKPT